MVGTDHIYSPQTKCIVKENAAFADPNIPFEGDLLLLEMVHSFNIILQRTTTKKRLLKKSNEGWVQMH